MVVYSEISQMMKDIGSVAKKINDSELNSLIIDLQGKVMDLYNENMELTNEVSTLKKEKDISSQITFDENGFVYYQEDGPYCPGCYGSDGILVRLIKPGMARYRYKCANCKTMFA